MTSDLGPHPAALAALRLLPKGEVAAKFRIEMHEREQRRAEQLAQAVSEQVPLGDLLQQVRDSDEFGEMFRLAVDAAVRSTSDLQVDLLGAALVGGSLARDRATVDEAAQMLRVAAEMDAVDVRAVLAFSGQPSTSNPWAFLMRKLPATDATAYAIVARLRRLGLLNSEPEASVGSVEDDRQYDAIDVEEHWDLTPTARALIELLRTRSRRTQD